MIKFKHDEDKDMFTMLHPALIMIFADLAAYAQLHHGIDLTVTETLTTPDEDARLNRVSNSHQQGRAIDIRTRDVDVFIVQDLLRYINTKRDYLKYHYESNSGKKRLAYYHIGNAEHIHLAIHSNYAIKY